LSSELDDCLQTSKEHFGAHQEGSLNADLETGTEFSYFEQGLNRICSKVVHGSISSRDGTGRVHFETSEQEMDLRLPAVSNVICEDGHWRVQVVQETGVGMPESDTLKISTEPRIIRASGAAEESNCFEMLDRLSIIEIPAGKKVDSVNPHCGQKIDDSPKDMVTIESKGSCISTQPNADEFMERISSVENFVRKHFPHSASLVRLVDAVAPIIHCNAGPTHAIAMPGPDDAALSDRANAIMNRIQGEKTRSRRHVGHVDSKLSTPAFSWSGDTSTGPDVSNSERPS
jgi:hypothetical protein